MKKFGLLVSLVLIFLTSCTEPITTVYREPCEENKTGEVTICNETNHGLIVDVTWGNLVENSERMLSDGHCLTYYDIPAGSIKIWASMDFGDNWSYDTDYLSSCEELEFTWYTYKAAEATVVSKK